MVNRQSCAKGGKCASKNAKMPKPKHVGLVAKDPYLEPYRPLSFWQTVPIL